MQGGLFCCYHSVRYNFECFIYSKNVFAFVIKSVHAYKVMHVLSLKLE
jgi:hypothetical protein